MKNVRWAKLEGFSNYEISDSGLVRNKKETLKPFTDKDGYHKIRLYNDAGVRKHFYINRLVWQAFIGPIPKGLEIDHAQGERWNNSLGCLAMVTKRLNNELKRQRVRNLSNITGSKKKKKAAI